MLKKTLALLSVGMLASAIVATPVMAAEETTRNTEASITFKNDTTIPKPIDPTEPGKNIVGEASSVGDSQLYLVSAPDKIDFGEAELKINDAIKVNPNPMTVKYTEEGDLFNRAHFVQVADLRSGGKGWELSVTQEKQFSAQNGTAELTGAKLKLEKASVSPAPGTDYMAPANMVNETSLTAAGSVPVMQATAGVQQQGMGHWIQQFGAMDNEKVDGISLEVPKGVGEAGEAYKSTLMWSLKDAPDTSSQEDA